MPAPDLTDWPFDDPPNVYVITTSHVLAGEPIVLVSRDDEDGMFQFHSARRFTMADAKIVSLWRVVSRDPTLKDLADLPCGWIAERRGVGENWHRSPEK